MTREKIVSLARECGAYVYFDSTEALVAFYRAAQAEAFEAAASACTEESPTLDGQLCAAAIRELPLLAMTE